MKTIFYLKTKITHFCLFNLIWSTNKFKMIVWRKGILISNDRAIMGNYFERKKNQRQFFKSQTSNNHRWWIDDNRKKEIYKEDSNHQKKSVRDRDNITIIIYSKIQFYLIFKRNMFYNEFYIYLIKFNMCIIWFWGV